MRGGCKKRPKYRITVADSRRWLGGRFLEVIGNFNPAPRGEEKKLVLDIAKAKEWIAKGAQPTSRVKSLIRLAQAGGQASAPAASATSAPTDTAVTPA
jgi:small subunit ribosomal protein S16